MRCRCISWIGAISLFVSLAGSLVGIGRNHLRLGGGLGSGPTTTFVRHARGASRQNPRLVWRKVGFTVARNVVPGRRITLRGGVNAEDYDEDQLRLAEQQRIYGWRMCMIRVQMPQNTTG
jgi:hypothetical protein